MTTNILAHKKYFIEMHGNIHENVLQTESRLLT